MGQNSNILSKQLIFPILFYMGEIYCKTGTSLFLFNIAFVKNVCLVPKHDTAHLNTYVCVGMGGCMSVDSVSKSLLLKLILYLHIFSQFLWELHSLHRCIFIKHKETNSHLKKRYVMSQSGCVQFIKQCCEADESNKTVYNRVRWKWKPLSSVQWMTHSVPFCLI